MEAGISPLFEVHILNDEGIAKAKGIARAFDSLLITLEEVCLENGKLGSREFSIVRTKLEEAAFFAKKAMALLPQNQKQ